MKTSPIIDTLTFHRRDKSGTLVMLTIQRDSGEETVDVFFQRVLKAVEAIGVYIQ